MSSPPSAPRPSVRASYAGKRVVLTGSTGFLGKVFLSALLKHCSEVGQVTVLVRAATQEAAEDRFLRDVVTSPAFEPLQEEHGLGLYDYVRERVRVVRGDLCKPLAGLDEETLAEVTRDLDLVVHCAGLVDFVPPLDKALDINVLGTLNCLDLARRAGKGRAGFVHVSTCFVCGSRPGQHPERLDPHDYPKRTHRGFEGFDAAKEYEVARRLVEEIRTQDPEDPAVLADLWEQAGGNRRRVKRLTDHHVRRRLVEVGIERAQRWGWPNTYTYSKALAERLVHAARDDLGPVTTVRPAVVESALAYPFPGWNQGINTSAPLVWMTAQGTRYWPTTPDVYLDVIPVDYVAHALVAIGAANLERRAEEVYQLGTSDKNPFAMRRVIELAALAYRDRELPGANLLVELARKKLGLEASWVTEGFYRRFGLPGQARLARGLGDALERVPTPDKSPRLRSLLQNLRTRVRTAARDLGRAEQVIDIYLPFIATCPVTFRCDNARRLFAELPAEDREAIPYEPATLDWRHYWKDVHIPGLERWAFPQLRLQAGGTTTEFEPEFKSLTALFEDRARFGRIALWRRIDGEGKVVQQVTYEGALSRARTCGRRLVARGVRPHDRVVLIAQNCPEWGMGYFGVLFSGATCVPLESGLEAERVLPLARASGARVVLLDAPDHEALAAELEGLARAEGLELEALRLEEMVAEKAPGEELPALPLEAELVPRAPASLIYTSGTTGSPKGVLLSHEAFCAQVRSIASIFSVGSEDRVLSVLPLHHCFEFSAGFLLPLYGGATVTYLPETSAEAIRVGLEKVRPTCMIGVPALFVAWQRKIRRQVKAKGPKAERAYDALLAFHRGFRARTQLNLGRRLFGEIHQAFGGSLRFAVSGGSALSREVALEFEGLGLDIYEGYGLSEAGPVLACNRPGDAEIGSVGKAIPGVELRIREPDGEGVGEILARSPSLFSGYDGDPEATARALRDGWLHTGDLGRLDEEGRLHVVGRLKDAIVDASGNTVHPDEVEDLYQGCPDVAELAVAGVPDEGGTHEVVGALVVPHSDVEGGPDAARERIRDFVRMRSESLPYPKRIKLLHFTARALPRTQTRKVKRAEVKRLLAELARASAGRRPRRRPARRRARGMAVDAAQVFEEVAGVDPAQVLPEAHLTEDLGLDSIALAEVALALAEHYGRPAPRSLSGIATVGDLLASLDQESGGALPRPIEADPRPLVLPEAVRSGGSALLDGLQRISYERILRSRVSGRGNIPYHTNAIVVANHVSHLDVGLVKYALGEYGDGIVSAGARDYFFNNTLKASYFENFTSVVPFDRHESVRESLDRFTGLLRQGKKVLIFPEGTRSVTGRMGSFKPGLGLLVQASRTGVLPVYVYGTHKAMPKGTWLPRIEPLEARIGPFLPPDLLLGRTAHLSRRRQAEAIVEVVRLALCALRDGEPFDPVEALSLLAGAAPPTPAQRLSSEAADASPQASARAGDPSGAR